MGIVGWVGEETYAAVEAPDAVMFEDVDESAEHAFWAIRSACLEADLRIVRSHGRLARKKIWGCV